MSDGSKIELTDATWNPVTGCIKLSPGCDHCYAERFAERFRNVPGHPYEQGFDLVYHPERLMQPYRWKKPRLIFVNSMSDLFLKSIPTQYINQVFDTIEGANWHIYQIFTKRSSLMRRYVNARYSRRAPPEHLWLGASVENRQARSRIEHLRSTRAAVRFICFEPLLERIGPIDLSGISWVIASGESGPGARPVQADWIREIRDQCLESEVPFFFKQWGGYRPKLHGAMLDGREWRQFPALPVGRPIGANETIAPGSTQRQN